MQYWLTELENKYKVEQGKERNISTPKQKTLSVEYVTDEEELATQTGWIKTDSIINGQKRNGLIILEALNKLKWKAKKPQHMFILMFNPEKNIKKICNIKHILCNKVDIHSVQKSKSIPKYKGCQAYGHTQRYCNRKPIWD